jgi:hypothetical protein
VAATANGLVGVGGWLALFVFGLIVLNPLRTVATLTTSNPISFLLSLAFAAFSIIAGIHLWKQHKPRAVLIAKWFLGFTMAYGTIPVLLALSADLPQEIKGNLVAEAFMSFIAISAYAGGWFLYLINSKRVFATYGTN